MTACPASDNSECWSRLLIKPLSLPHRDHSWHLCGLAQSLSLEKVCRTGDHRFFKMGWNPVLPSISKCYKSEARAPEGPLVLVCQWQPQCTSVIPHQSIIVPCLSSKDVLLWTIMWPPHLRTVLIQFHIRYSLLQQTRGQEVWVQVNSVLWDHGQDLWPLWRSHSPLGS